MATAGILGSADLAATTETLLYTCPASTIAFVAVSCCSRSGTPSVRLALADNGVPDDKDWLEYDTPVPVGGPLIREGILMKATDRIYVEASAANVTAVVYGKEEAV